MDNHQSENKTIFNQNIDSSETVLNSAINAQETIINTELSTGNSIPLGTILCEVYEVIEKLDVIAGEADLYICSFAARKYIAKVYRRKIAIKPEVAKRLAEIRSPFVARIFAMGEYNGYPVEILPLYINGSLAGKTFSFEQLKYEIIPSVNEGLHILHTNNIIHKDVKPSNLMLNNDGRTVAIIDFGISSIRDSGSTVIVTRTGLTPEYSAPETFRNLFLSESDYYSFGITIYELYCGHSPSQGLTQEQIEQFTLIQQPPIPDDMEEELKDLINALTYTDIRNRKDKSNPNRRWGYEEVINWCNDVPQPLPGISGTSSNTLAYKAQKTIYQNVSSDEDMLPYRFAGQSITSTKVLAKLLNERWDEGKKHLFRGLLLEHFKKDSNAEIISYLMDFQEEAETANPDVLMFRCIYAIDSSQKKLLWKGEIFDNLSELGYQYLKAIRSENTTFIDMMNEMQFMGILSLYVQIIDPTAKKQINTLRAIESEYRSFSGSKEESLSKQYRLAYMLSDKKDYEIDSNLFSDIPSYVKHINEKATKNGNTFEYELRSDIYPNGNFNAQFINWIQAIDRSDILGQSIDKKDEAFFDLIYRINPDYKSLSWNNNQYANIYDLGVKYLSALRLEKVAIISTIDELFENKCVSRFLRYTSPSEKNNIDRIELFEQQFKNVVSKHDRESMVFRFKLAYELSGDKTLYIGKKHFSSLEDLVSFLHSQFSNSLKLFDEYCNELMIDDYTLCPQFEVWLAVLGKSKAIDSWASGAPFMTKKEKALKFREYILKIEQGQNISLHNRYKWYSELASIFDEFTPFEASASYAKKCRYYAEEAIKLVTKQKRIAEYKKILAKLDDKNTIPQDQREEWYLSLAEELSEYADIEEVQEKINQCKKEARTYHIICLYNDAIRLKAKAQRANNEERRELYAKAAALFASLGTAYEADKMAKECENLARIESANDVNGI
ncbi:serine/threonine protein kinase [Aristaeella lactis]|uniref:Serine/threonine protein kinase n=1 Tax=Aristaeella lactis TaxID=3046383 RepID=A0AC61PLH9_9FIRM|nr:protein kinase [Aristaeella lactis]QUA54670.1 protein kinase [Aristaeella lactis]SMC63513.1 Serine/threonine protein kinase [Aristaeella lactis]